MDTVRSVRRRLSHIVSNAPAAEAPIANFSGPTLVLSRAVNTKHGMVHGAASRQRDPQALSFLKSVDTRRRMSDPSAHRQDRCRLG